MEAMISFIILFSLYSNVKYMKNTKERRTS